jgi:MoxR-like ATPase
MDDWKVFLGTREPHEGVRDLLAGEPPPWRDFRKSPLQFDEDRGKTYQASSREIDMVNAALYLRRPLLVTGPPGSGKSSLAYAVSYELRLGPVLYWPINSRTTLTDGLYCYDAVARLRDANLVREGQREPAQGEDVGRYLRLGPLGTALLPRDRPRVLLVDEIDKSDIDLPNDLLHVLETGSFEIAELARIAKVRPKVSVRTWDPLPQAGERESGEAASGLAEIEEGRVRCKTFPFILLTSNGERELPPPFFRRCLRLDLPDPDQERLRRVITAHLRQPDANLTDQLIERFMNCRASGGVLAIDQLLNALFLIGKGRIPDGQERDELVDALLKELGS